MSDDPIVVVGGARTPVGRFGGSLKDVDAGELAGVATPRRLSVPACSHRTWTR